MMILKTGKNMFVCNVESIPISLIKEWCFCPRTFYYQHILNLNSKKPLWLAQGKEAHKRIENLEKRRGFFRYKLNNSIRHFNVEVYSDKYNIHGIIDSVLEQEKEIFVIEYKLNPSVKILGHIMQLQAYSLCASEVFKKPCKISFLSGEKKNYEIKNTTDRKEKLLEILNQMRKIGANFQKPDTSASKYQCVQCEYLNYCNDRL